MPNNYSFDFPNRAECQFCPNSCIENQDKTRHDGTPYGFVGPVVRNNSECKWYIHTELGCSPGIPGHALNSCGRGFRRFLKERKASRVSPYKTDGLYYTITISPESGTMTGELLESLFLKKFVSKKNCYSPYLNSFCIEHYNGTNPHIHCAFRAERQLQLKELPRFMYNAKTMKKVTDSTYQGGGMRLQFNTSSTKFKPHTTSSKNHLFTMDYCQKMEDDKKVFSLQGGKARLIKDL